MFMELMVKSAIEKVLNDDKLTSWHRGDNFISGKSAVKLNFSH